MTRLSIAGGVFTSLGICAACCLLPFVLILLGVGGAWIGALETLAPYKWYFVGLTVALLGFGFYAVYWKPRKCAAGRQCASCRPGRVTRISLWLATALALAGFAFEYIEPLLGG